MNLDKLTAIITPILSEWGLELESIDVTPAGKRKTLRITVDGDGPEGRGPLLDDISAASGRISSALDASDAVGNAPYSLEVSSRGVSAPLTKPAHYRRNTGRLVKLTLGDGEVLGRIVSATDDDVTLDADGQQRTIPLADVSKASIQVELTKEK